MSTTNAELEKQIKQWVQPISEAAPTGGEPYADPRYLTVKQELAKISSLTAGNAPDWPQVIKAGGDLLGTGSKDLMVASAVAYGLQVTGAEAGLAAGLMLVAELVETYWDKMYPALPRIKPRANAISWLNDRASGKLAEASKIDAASFERLQAAAQKFSSVVNDKFGPNAPSLRTLREELERLRMSAIAPEPEPAAAAPTPVAAPAAPTPAARAPTPPPPQPAKVAPPPAPVATPQLAAEPASAEDAQKYLRETGAALAKTAQLLRRASNMNAQAYRLLRIGVWLHLSDPPPAGADRKTSTIGPSPENRGALQQFANAGNWAALLDRAETLIPNHCYSLDLQRYSATALKNLGASHEAAHRAVVAEVGTFVRRMKNVAELFHSDSQPFADEDTKTWLNSEVLAGGGPSAGAAVSSAPPPVLAIKAKDSSAEQDELAAALSGKTAPDAIAVLQARCGTAPTAEERFRLRLHLARLAFSAGKVDLAFAVFETLETECSERGLDDWAPELASIYLRAHIECLRAVGKRKKDSSLDGAGLYRRLCRIDPVAALALAI